jgi:hypothetical protein
MESKLMSFDSIKTNKNNALKKKKLGFLNTFTVSLAIGVKTAKAVLLQ